MVGLDAQSSIDLKPGELSISIRDFLRISKILGGRGEAFVALQSLLHEMKLTKQEPDKTRIAVEASDGRNQGFTNDT